MQSLEYQVKQALENGERVCAKAFGFSDWFTIDAMEWRNGNELYVRCSEAPIQPMFSPELGAWVRVKDIEVQ